MLTYRVFREYPGSMKPQQEESSLSGAQNLAASGGSIWDTRGDDAEASGRKVGGGGVWVLDAGGKRHVLRSIRADPHRRLGLLFATVDGEIDATCDDQESFRMWLGVGAVVCPSIDEGRVA